MQDAPATEAPGPCGGTLLLGVASCHGPAELSVGELVLTLCLPSRISICLERPCRYEIACIAIGDVVYYIYVYMPLLGYSLPIDIYTYTYMYVCYILHKPTFVVA